MAYSVRLYAASGVIQAWMAETLPRARRDIELQARALGDAFRHAEASANVHLGLQVNFTLQKGWSDGHPRVLSDLAARAAAAET